MPFVKVNGTHTLECASGLNLMTLLVCSGYELNNACGGRGVCGKCKVRIPNTSESELSKTEKMFLTPEEQRQGIRLACMVRVRQDLEVETLSREKEYAVLAEGHLPEWAAEQSKDPAKSGEYGIAADVGTTTVVCRLIHLETGKTADTAASVNDQKKFGLDVLSRISYEQDHPEFGRKELQDAIVGNLNRLIEEMCRRQELSPESIRRIAISGNCTMVHMLLGADAVPLGKAPFLPVLKGAQRCFAGEIGLKPEGAELYCIPAVSAYIGGDIVAGAYICGLKKLSGNVLFVDIGTNGEIVLARDGEMNSCSCAAGPALEGMNIQQGMRGETGAIEDVEIRPDGIHLKVIGGGPAEGICGSGILAGIKELLRCGVLRKSGAFVHPDRLPEGDERKEYLQVNPEDGTRSVRLQENPVPVNITQKDIRQVQLAKGAIRSGIEILLENNGLEPSMLDEVMIAGQFGSHLPPEDLTGVGILPEEVRDRIHYVGNTALTGAVAALLSEGVRREMEALAKEIGYTELGETPEYEYRLAEWLEFPKCRLY